MRMFFLHVVECLNYLLLNVFLIMRTYFGGDDHRLVYFPLSDSLSVFSLVNH